MTEDELRTLVRDAVARYLGGPHPETRGFRLQAEDLPARAGSHEATPIPRHPSHRLLPILPGSDLGGPCLIEPVVGCTHCGYCQSYGH